jgi:hypothetical protein
MKLSTPLHFGFEAERTLLVSIGARRWTQARVRIGRSFGLEQC